MMIFRYSDIDMIIYLFKNIYFEALKTVKVLP